MTLEERIEALEKKVADHIGYTEEKERAHQELSIVRAEENLKTFKIMVIASAFSIIALALWAYIYF